MGGSYIYHGAPILSSIAALRCGTDLVYTSVPKINATATRAISPNLIVIPLVDQKLTRGAVHKLLGAIPRNLDSATIGMGLAVQEKNALLLLVKSSEGGYRLEHMVEDMRLWNYWITSTNAAGLSLWSLTSQALLSTLDESSSLTMG